jgi:hypothetical protein
MSKRTKPNKLQRITATEISGQQATHGHTNATVYTLDTGKATVHTAHLVSTVATPKLLPPVDDHQHVEDSQERYDEDQEQHMDNSTDYVNASDSGKRKHTTGVCFVF